MTLELNPPTRLRTYDAISTQTIYGKDLKASGKSGLLSGLASMSNDLPPRGKSCVAMGR